MALLNVRLEVEDQRRVADLRRAGVQLSKLVRAAIRTEHARRIEGRAAKPAPSLVVKEILASLPDPPSAASRGKRADRRAVRRRIVAKLKREHP